VAELWGITVGSQASERESVCECVRACELHGRCISIQLAGIPEIFQGLLPTRLKRRFEVMAIKGQTGNRQKKMEVGKSTEVVGFERERKQPKNPEKSIAETQGQAKERSVRMTFIQAEGGEGGRGRGEENKKKVCSVSA
jgi:hypothetical protein